VIDGEELLGFFRDEYRRARGSRRDVRPGDRLSDDLGIDSLLANELLVAVEDRYDVFLLHDPRVWQVTTVEQLLDLVRSVKEAQAARAVESGA
jgi:acyl carrier protein